jgi:DNA-binding NarL/FixJ family response regulator
VPVRSRPNTLESRTDAPAVMEDDPGVGATVLIVDDHAGFRRSASLLLEAEGWEVVGVAADASGALSATRRLAPNLVVLDVHLPDGDGFEVAARLRAEPDPPQVVLVSSHDYGDLGELVRLSGAAGFVTKGQLSAAALEALLA